jgi:hypothetical protein
MRSLGSVALWGRVVPDGNHTDETLSYFRCSARVRSFRVRARQAIFAQGVYGWGKHFAGLQDAVPPLADNCSDKAVKKSSAPRFAPFCSDDHPEARLTPGREDTSNAYTRAGLVYCQPYFSFEEQRGPLFTIADIPATTRFDFYQDRLYRISATFYASRFTAMQEALTGKYGTPSSITAVDYQNTFGAKFTGSVVTWDNGTSVLTLRQYGTGSVENSGLVIEHKALAAQAAAARPKQPSKDL